jgi:hypothetical protein
LQSVTHDVDCFNLRETMKVDILISELHVVILDCEDLHLSVVIAFLELLSVSFSFCLVTLGIKLVAILHSYLKLIQCELSLLIKLACLNPRLHKDLLQSISVASLEVEEMQLFKKLRSPKVSISIKRASNRTPSICYFLFLFG